MNVVRIRKQLTSPTLELPELAAFIGKDVEILIIDEVADQAPRSGVRFAVDDGLDLEPISEAMMESGALSRLA